MELLILLAVIAAVVVTVSVVRSRREAETRRQELESVRRTTGEDVTRFGEELQALDADVAGQELEVATRQDYQRALDCYEQAKESLDAVTDASQIKHVIEVLEDGRYAIACVQARIAHEPLPQRRPPCFFNPAHGPSTEDVEWAPAGGQVREIPVCAADAERVQAGAEPDIKTVMRGPQRVPYWQGGRAYAPYAQGYFSAYPMGGLLPGLLIGSMLADPFGGFDGGMDGAGDFGGDMGGGDFGGGDMGGFDGGGFDMGDFGF